MRKPAGPPAFHRKCARNSQFELPLYGRRFACPGQPKRSPYNSSAVLVLVVVPVLDKNRERRSKTRRRMTKRTKWGVEHSPLSVEHLGLASSISRVTPGHRLLLRDVPQTGDVAYLPADHRVETMRSKGDCTETRTIRALPIRVRPHCSQTGDAFLPAPLVQATSRHAVADLIHRAAHITGSFK